MLGLFLLAPVLCTLQASASTIHVVLDDGRGHLDAYTDLAVELAARGHDVSILMPHRASPWFQGAKHKLASACGLLAAHPTHWHTVPNSLALLADASPERVRQHCSAALDRLHFVPFSTLSEDNFTHVLEATTRGGYGGVAQVRELLRVIAALHRTWLGELAAHYAAHALPDVLLVDASKPLGEDLAELTGMRGRTVRLSPASSAGVFDRPLWYPSLSGEPIATSGTLQRVGRLVARGIGMALFHVLWADVRVARAEHGLPPPGWGTYSWGAPPPVLSQWPWGLEWPHASRPSAERIGPARNFALLDAVRALQPFGPAADGACGGDSESHSECAALEAWLAGPSSAAPSFTGLPVVFVSLGTALVTNEGVVEALARGLLGDHAHCLAPSEPGAASEPDRCTPPYRVVWSLRNMTAIPPWLGGQGAHGRGAAPSRLRDGVLFLPRVPQESLLAHPSLALFVSHCGANSLLQSLDAGQPLLCVPFNYDQPENAAAVVARGAGEALEWKVPGFAAAIATTVAGMLAPANRSRYAEAARRLGVICRTAGGLRRAVEVVERTAALGSSSFLADPSLPGSGVLGYWQATYADAIALLLLLSGAGLAYALWRGCSALSTRVGAAAGYVAGGACLYYAHAILAAVDPSLAGGAATLAGFVCAACGLLVLLLEAGLLSMLWAPLPTAPSARRVRCKANGRSATVTCWGHMEADFIFDEIFGPEDTYGRGPTPAPGSQSGDDAATTSGSGSSSWGCLAYTPGMTVVDAGGNIGLFALYAAARCGGNVVVHSFEPIPHVHAALSANGRAAQAGQLDGLLQSAGWRSARGTPQATRLHAHNFALGSAPGSATFSFHPLASGWSSMDPSFGPGLRCRMEADLRLIFTSTPGLSLLPEWAWGWFVRGMVAKAAVTLPVPARVTTLSAFLDSHSLGVVDLLKVDVEGAELEVLRGISESHWPTIRQAVVEATDFATADAVCALLAGHGFALRRVAADAERIKGSASQTSIVYAWREGQPHKAAAGDMKEAQSAPVAQYLQQSAGATNEPSQYESSALSATKEDAPAKAPVPMRARQRAASTARTSSRR